MLAALPQPDRERWIEELEPVQLALGMTLQESGRPLHHAYFPGSAVVSLLMLTSAGDTSEVAVVGQDGMVGVSLFMGGETLPSRAVVQSAGLGHRVPAAFLKSEFNRSVGVMRLLLRYTQALFAQTAQLALCNRHHPVEQQLCRRLLQNLDRLPGDEVLMTHELLARLLGVRREGVTDAARKLKDDGLIRYSRGRINVLDRLGLARRSCECYGVGKAESDRLKPAPADIEEVPRRVA